VKHSGRQTILMPTICVRGAVRTLRRHSITTFVLLFLADSAVAEAVDDCRAQAGSSPQVRLLEDDGNTVTVHVLDPASESEWQVLADASDEGHGVGRLGTCGETSLQIYVVVKRPLTGSVSEDEQPTDPAPDEPDAPPPADPTAPAPPVLPGSVDLNCRGTYTECYGRNRGPLPGYSGGTPDGDKGIRRIPGPPRRGDEPAPAVPSLETTIEQCLRPHFPDYTTPGWGRFASVAQQGGGRTPVQYTFPIIQIAVRQALAAEQRRYGKLPYGDHSRAYLEGWLGRCLLDSGVITPGEDPRAPYRQFLARQGLSSADLDEQFYDWEVGFRSTWSPWPWHVTRGRARSAP